MDVADASGNTAHVAHSASFAAAADPSDEASSSGETNARIFARARTRASISVTVVVVGGVTLLGFVNEEPRRFTNESPEKARLRIAK